MQMHVYVPDARTAEDLARRQRCKNLPPLQVHEVRHLMAAFLATRSVTICPTRYAVPSEQGSVNRPGW